MKIVALAGVTLREALRRKVQVNLLLFALFLVVASLVLSQLTIGEKCTGSRRTSASQAWR